MSIIKNILKNGNTPHKCGCVVKGTSTNTHIVITYCSKHYNQLSWDVQEGRVQTSPSVIEAIDEYFAEPLECNEDQIEEIEEIEEIDPWDYDEDSFSPPPGEPHLGFP